MAFYNYTIGTWPVMDILMTRLHALTGAATVRQRVAIARTALGLVSPATDAALWASLHVELARSLAQDQLGWREQNIAAAIEHYGYALPVFDEHAFPENWALIQSELGNLYLQLLGGERTENLEQAIAHYERALRVFTHETFANNWAPIKWNLAITYFNRLQGDRAVNLDSAIACYQEAQLFFTRRAWLQNWAQLEMNLGNAYQQHPGGNRADNLERAIRHYRRALSGLDRQADRESWCWLQLCLGNTYFARITGERAKNMERAIAYYRQALTFSPPEIADQTWAAGQLWLGMAYSQRLRGRRAANLELAIGHWQNALRVYTYEHHRDDWAVVQLNLGQIYALRARGDRAENVEQALTCLEQALLVFGTRGSLDNQVAAELALGNAYSQRVQGDRAASLEEAIAHYDRALQLAGGNAEGSQAAHVELGLGTAYLQRLRGARAENVEQAIAHYGRALRNFAEATEPLNWAWIMMSLGSAYSQRALGDRAENVEQAIDYYKQSLRVFSVQVGRENWAWVQMALGSLYYERSRGERQSNLEQAIARYRQALRIFSYKASGSNWGTLQINLGHAFSMLEAGDRAANLEEATEHYRQALEFYSYERFPQEWATAQMNLGRVVSMRVPRDAAENAAQAITYYRGALGVFTPATSPRGCRDTAYALGRLLYDRGCLAEARKSLELAHEAVVALIGETSARWELSIENAGLYEALVHCCLHEGDIIAAFEYAVTAKGRAFADLLYNSHLILLIDSGDPQFVADYKAVVAVENEIASINGVLTAASRPSPFRVSGSMADQSSRGPEEISRALTTELATLHEVHDALWQHLNSAYPAFFAARRAHALAAGHLKTLSAELDATLVEYYRHGGGWCAFIVTPDDIHCIDLPLLDDHLLAAMAEWIDDLRLPQGRSLLSLEQLDVLEQAAVAPLRALLEPEQGVMLAPFGPLHSIPLAASRERPGGRFLAEDYLVGFIPSLSALSMIYQEAFRGGVAAAAQPRRLLSIAYPGGNGEPDYLENVLAEAEAIGRQFDSVTELLGSAATPEAVISNAHGHDVVHFGCHGMYDQGRVLQSGLLLAGGMLTVERIWTELRLPQARLATLAACSSGVAGVSRGEEYIGLLHSLLAAGARGVVASLWQVNDPATRVLFETFYARLVAGESAAHALQVAGASVRRQPGWGHPFYWAAFQATGLVLEDGNLSDARPATESFQIPAATPAMRGRQVVSDDSRAAEALILLRQMGKHPATVLEQLEAGERDRLLRGLDELATAAASVQTSPQLAALADALYDLVAQSTRLRHLLLPPDFDNRSPGAVRTITTADMREAEKKSTYALENAAQLRNSLVHARDQLRSALQPDSARTTPITQPGAAGPPPKTGS